MKTLLTVEKAVRKTVFTNVWKFFGVKDLTDLALLAIGGTCASSLIYFLAKGFINWL